MAELPSTSPDQVAQFQSEYESAFRGGTEDELEAAKCRLIWSLVHSTKASHQERGLGLAEAALSSDQRTADQDRELRYFKAVALYNLSRYLDARHAINDLIRSYPDFRQAEALKSAIDDKVVRDGLIGVSVAGAVVAGVVGLAVALARGNRG